MDSIKELSWKKTSFLSKLKLFFKSQKEEREKIRSNFTKAQGYSALSSTYYSIVGSAFARLKSTLCPKQKLLILIAPIRMLVWLFTWFPLAAWCYFRMLHFSDRVVALLTYKRMSADECDVRQSILLLRHRYHQAKTCIKVALSKNPEKAHTRGLLHAGLAKIYYRYREWRRAEEETRVAVAEAEEAESNEPMQAARIYRICSTIPSFAGGDDPICNKRLRRKAEELAISSGASDQLQKLR